MFGFRQTHVELHKLLGQRPKVEIVAGNPWVFALKFHFKWLNRISAVPADFSLNQFRDLVAGRFCA
jgi:hypothetical protein